MAGVYPDTIGPRVPYDRDGTVGLVYTTSSGSITQLSAGTMTNLNRETSNTTHLLGGSSASIYIGFIFPTPIDMNGYFVAVSGNTSNWTFGAVQTSADTTNLVDGTWTQIAASHSIAGSASPNYRTGQIALAASAIKGIRFRITSGAGSVSLYWADVHILGKYTNVTDRLELWHPTLDQPLTQTPAYFDYGDVSRGTGAITKDFRIKNLSTTLTASTITVGVEAPTDTSPTYVSQTTFRYNGGSYASTASLASLAPGAISLTFTAKLDTLSTAILGPWAQRYYAQAAGWA